MKKVAILTGFAATFLLMVSLVSAVEFDMKPEFRKGETLMAKLSGQFTKTPVSEKNIEFFRGHVRIGMEFEIAKIGESFYLFASLTGKDPGNYSVVIDDVEYKHEGEFTDEPLVRNFTIIDEVADFSVNKGFISTNDDFSITVDNLGDTSIDIELEITTVSGEEGGISEYEDDDSYEISVSPGEKTIEFTLASGAKSSIKEISLKSENMNYTVPVSIFIDEVAAEDKIYAFDIAPPELEITMPTNSNLTKLIYIYNTGTGRLSDIEVDLDESLKPYLRITEDTFGQVLPENNANFEVIIVSGAEQSLGGDIRVSTAEGVSDSIRVSLNIVAGYEPAEEEQQQDISTTQTCEEIGGDVCIDDEECEGDYVFAKNQFCCIGKCTAPASSSWGKIIGWIIVIAVIAIGAWFFLTKYKKSPKPVNLLKVAQGKK